MTNGSLLKVESIVECSPWSILQYFGPALSDNRSCKPNVGLLFEWPLNTGFAVICISDPPTVYSHRTLHLAMLNTLHLERHTPWMNNVTFNMAVAQLPAIYQLV